MISAFVGLQAAQGAHRGDCRKKEVDEKGPAPRDVGREDSAEQQSERPSRSGDSTIDPEGLPPLLRIDEGGGQEGQYGRGEQGPESALDGPGYDQHHEVN